MGDLTKAAVQCLLRNYDWSYHIVIEGRDVMRMGDQATLSRLKELNFGLCKKWLSRKFARLPLEQRFHWVACFQSSREFGDRHLHLLLHVPSSVPADTCVRRLKFSQSLQGAWLRVRDRSAVPWLWHRRIEDAADNKAVATYVSRELTRTTWEAEDVHFSQ